MRTMFITAAAAVSLLGAPALAQDATATAETPEGSATATLAAEPTTGDTTTTVDTINGAIAADPAMADTTMATTDPMAMPVEREDDNDFPWGLLGLLGLAGLLGRNKRDTHVHHETVNHDATVRRDV